MPSPEGWATAEYFMTGKCLCKYLYVFISIYNIFFNLFLIFCAKSKGNCYYKKQDISVSNLGLNSLATEIISVVSPLGKKRLQFCLSAVTHLNCEFSSYESLVVCNDRRFMSTQESELLEKFCTTGEAAFLGGDLVHDRGFPRPW